MIVRKLEGRQYGRLTVLREDGRTAAQKKIWFCECLCGGNTRATTGDLLNGTSQSCGCLQREMTAKANKRHGQSYTRSYSIWRTMIRRCTDKTHPTYLNYGARGITVCEEWLSHKTFLRDMGSPPDGLTLDRKNNSLGYFPKNCRWATKKEQSRNMRSTKFVSMMGKTLCIADWAEELKKHPSTISRRFKDPKEIGLIKV